MEKKNYAIVALGVFVMVEGILYIIGNFHSGLPIFFSISNYILALMVIAMGFFLIKLNEWARKGILVLSVIYFILGITRAAVIASNRSLLSNEHLHKIINWPIFIHYIIFLLMFYYLTRPQVKQLFK